MNIIEKAGLFMAARCANQRDKIGADYRLHPLRVARGLQVRGAVDYIVAAAVLHDMVEDERATDDELESLFGPKVAGLVMILTRQAGESYPSYIARVALDPAATIIKLADLADNMRMDRVAELPADVAYRLLTKYRHAFNVLRDASVQHARAG